MTRLRPYTTPWLPEYLSGAFARATRVAAPMIQAMVDQTPGYRRDGPWVMRADKARQRRPWQPKLYVCVRARDYWRVVAGLVVLFDDDELQWKFFLGDRKYYARPDKIVVYPSSEADLVGRIRQLRPLLDGARFHSLAHVASTVDMGMERRGARGLFVGSDPTFLESSWRSYRSTCLAWYSTNRRYLDARHGSSGWLKLMNLSSRHEGPVSVCPEGMDVRAVRRFWKSMFPAT
jgi:hypothetical protein